MSRACDIPAEWLGLLALDALEDERAACDDHLQTCASCRDETARLRRTVQDLVLAGPSVLPPPHLRSRLDARIREADRRSTPDLRSRARTWIPAGDGIEISQLWIDLESERHALFIRMQPDARLAEHHHAGPEECFVVRGDLEDGRTRLREGDFVCFEVGSRHSVSTRGGCTLFVMASLRDSVVSPD